MNIPQYLQENKVLTYSNVGVSMMPLLKQGRDTFTVTEKAAYLGKKGEKRFKAGDVVLYHRPPNKYVLHRIIEVRPDGYVILGDNCIAKEYGIKDEDIMGIMTAYSRKGKNHTVDEPGYLRYTHRMLTQYPVRVFFQRIVFKAKRVVKKIIRYHGK